MVWFDAAYKSSTSSVCYLCAAEVFLLALGRSVASLGAPFCAAVLQCGLLAGIIETLHSPSILAWILCPTSSFPGSGVREEEVGPPLSGTVVSFVPARLVWT